MSREFGIERYIDVAKEQTKAPGPEGPDGDQSTGPVILYTSILSFTILAGHPQTVAEYDIGGGLIGADDTVRVEWWGNDPDGDGIGFDQITVRIYWDGTLLSTVSSSPITGVFVTDFMEMLSNYISVSTSGPGTPAYTQFTNLLYPRWRENGGTITMTVETALPSTSSGICVRVIRNKQ